MPSPSEGNLLTINGLFSTLRRRRPVIFAWTGACFLLAVLVCIFMTRMYRADGEIQIAKSATDGVGLDNLMGPVDVASDALSESMALQTQANILLSDTLALKVIEDLNLEHTKDFQPIWNPIGWALGLISPGGPKDPANASLEEAPSRRTRVLKVFNSHLKVTPVSGTRLIDIKYFSSDPKTAAAVVNHLMAGLVDFGFQSRNTATEQAQQWLGGQLSDVKQQAESLQAKVGDLQKQAGVYTLGTNDADSKDSPYSLTLDRLQQGTAALTSAESQRILKGEIYEMVKSRNPELISGLAGSSLSGASPGILNSFNLIQSLRTQEATLEGQLATDSSKFGPAYPKLRDEQASLTSIRQQIQAEANRIGERAENDYRVAQETETALRQSYDRDKAEAGNLNDKTIQYSIAKQEAEQTRTLYDTLFQRMKEANVLTGLQSSNVTVVEPGRIPAKPNKPNVPIYLAASIVGGLFLGLVAALYLDVTDEKIQSFKPIVAELQVPLMGVLPLLEEGNSGRSLPIFKQKQLSQNGTARSFPRLAVLEGSGGAFAEALRALRTSLQLPKSSNSLPPKVILVTSSAPQEGKSTISSNLAALLALSGEKVLLIDGDMRQPSLASRFGPSNKPDLGLSTLLASNGSRRDIPLDPVEQVPGLFLLRSGPVPEFPSELLGKGRMQSLIEELKPSFDHIVIDSPPLLAVTDATIISHFADMTLLVVREDLTTLRALRRANEVLAGDEGSRLGFVLNGVSRYSDSYEDYCQYPGASQYQEGYEAVHV